MNSLAHPDRTERINLMTECILRLKKLFFLAPSRQVFLFVFAIFNVEIAREFRETFRQPLVVIALPSNAVSPPLMGGFVSAKEIGDFDRVFETDGVALGDVEKGCGPQINQARP